MITAQDPQDTEDMATQAAQAVAPPPAVAPEPETPKASLPVDPDDPQSPEEKQDQRNAAMRVLYGESFPLAQDVQPPESGDYSAWARELWVRHEDWRRQRLRDIVRNRLFRQGEQWISSSYGGEWREPPKPKDVTRAVNNMIRPALDQRIQLIAEQRPGMRTRPMTQDPDNLKGAEAKQLALEYQFDQQNMPDVIRETAYWTGTDGVAFWMLYWDANKGEVHDEHQTDPMTGNPVTDAAGQPIVTARYPVGDIAPRLLKIEQVAVSANSTATQAPSYWCIREDIPLAEAVAFHGSAVANGRARVDGSTYTAYQRSYADFDRDRLTNQETVERFTVFCAPSEFLPNGLTVVSVGDKEMFVGDLPIQRVPMVRITDGSTDPSFYPTPIMNDWLDHQVRMNAVLSKIIDSVRINSGGRFLARPKAVSTETLVGGLFSIIEVRGSGPVGDQVTQLPSFSVGEDAMALIASEQKSFEAKSGWSDASRGAFSDDTSGRAILAAREQLERVFADPIAAFARAMVDWGEISLQWMQWGYDLPRTIGVLGTGRPDLARTLSKEDLNGAVRVHIDPETLMPMPRALRLFLLDQMFDKGVLSPQEYRRRMPFAYIQNIDSPDDDQQSRARRVAEAIRQSQPPPEMRWQDNEAIHQDVLERELILRDDLTPQVIAAAQQRWTQLAQQAAQKQGGPPPGAPPPPPPGPPPKGPTGPPGGAHGASPFKPTAQNTPLLMNNPSVAAQNSAITSGQQNQANAAQLFDSSRPY